MVRDAVRKPAIRSCRGKYLIKDLSMKKDSSGDSGEGKSKKKLKKSLRHEKRTDLFQTISASKISLQGKEGAIWKVATITAEASGAGDLKTRREGGRKRRKTRILRQKDACREAVPMGVKNSGSRLAHPSPGTAESLKKGKKEK